jgi:hypothetical protein
VRPDKPVQLTDGGDSVDSHFSAPSRPTLALS